MVYKFRLVQPVRDLYLSATVWFRHDYTIGTLDVLQACDACADMGMTYSVIVQCTNCVVFPWFMDR